MYCSDLVPEHFYINPIDAKISLFDATRLTPTMEKMVLNEEMMSLKKAVDICPVKIIKLIKVK